MDFLISFIIKAIMILIIITFFYLWNKFIIKNFVSFLVSSFQKMNGYKRDKDYDKFAYSLYAGAFWVAAFFLIFVILKTTI